MKVLVTGASGFIGGHLVEALVAQGHQVRCLVRPTSSAENLAPLGVELVRGDIADKEAVAGAVAGVETVFHLVGGGARSLRRRPSYAQLRELNVHSLGNLLEACIGQSLRSVVFFSSVAAMGFQDGVELDEESPCRPRFPYERAKYEAEGLARSYFERSGVPVVILRLPKVYGPGDTHFEVLALARGVKWGFLPVLGQGQALRPWVYVKDAAAGAILAGSTPRAVGQTYVISDRQSYPLKYILQTMARELGVRPHFIPVPLGFGKVGLRALEALGTTTGLLHLHLQALASHRRASIAKAQRELGYKPRFDLEQGLKETLGWYQKGGYL